MSRDEAVVLHVEIPNDAAAALVGRAAAKITAIEASSGASVSFIDPGTEAWIPKHPFPV